MNGKVVAICICPVAGEKMQRVQKVEAIAGQGLAGDRYATGEGSFNKGTKGKRQVTLISYPSFINTGFTYEDSRRNIVTVGVELSSLYGKEFRVGNALLRGIKYCDPCNRPSILAGKVGFREKFLNTGGLVAEVVQSGTVSVDDAVIPPPKQN